MRFYLLLFALVGVGFACTRKADENAGLNQAPLASVNVKEITLSDETNLVSRVHLYWTGSDADGVVKGFKISINNQPYSPLLTRTDSLFLFTLTSGNPTEVISFRVIAVDQLNAESEPAELLLPVRNTRPDAEFNVNFLPRLDTALAVLSLAFIASDKDGDNTLDSVEIRVNGGPWFTMAPNISAVVLIPENPRVTGTQSAAVYSSIKLNGATVLQPKRLQGLVVGGFNTFEVRATDQAGAVSDTGKIFTSTGAVKSIYIRPITSDFLVLDAHPGTAAPTPESIYNPVLAAAYPQGYDKIDLLYAGGKNQQRIFQTTFQYLLSQYNKVFWYSDPTRLIPAPNGGNISANRIDTALLLVETFAPLFADYINQPGKHLLFSARLPNGGNRLPITSPIYGLLPVDSITFISNRVQLGRNRVIPSLDVTPDKGYPNLRTLTPAQDGTVLSGVDTFFPNSQTDSIFAAPVTFPSPYPTYRISRVVGGRYPKGSASPSLIFFTVDLDRFAGDVSTGQTKPEFTDFFTKVLTRDFQ